MTGFQDDRIPIPISWTQTSLYHTSSSHLCGMTDGIPEGRQAGVLLLGTGEQTWFLD